MLIGITAEAEVGSAYELGFVRVEGWRLRIWDWDLGFKFMYIMLCFDVIVHLQKCFFFHTRAVPG